MPIAASRRTWLALLFLLAAAFIAAPAHAQQATVLRWKWAAGQTLRYRMNQEMKQTITGIEDKEVSWTVQYVVRQEVKSISEKGIATVEQTYESGQVNAEERPGDRVKFDSTNPADKDKAGHRLIAPYAAFIGKTITFDVGPEGEVPRLEGASAIVDSALANTQTDPMTQMLLAQFRDSLGDEAMRKELELALRVVPDKPCKTGDHWDVAFDQPMPIVGTIHNQITYKLRKLLGKPGARMAGIEATGKLSQGAAAGGEGKDVGGGLGAMLGGLIDIKLKNSKVEGDAIFDVDQGRIEQSGYTVVSEWEIGLKGAGDDGEKPLPGEAAAATKGTQRLEQHARLQLIR